MFSVYGLLLTIQILSAVSIIGLVLLQHGKGSDMGSSFGGGSSSGVFGARGPANVLAKATKWAAVVFFVVTCFLAYIGGNRAMTENTDGGVMQNVTIPDAPVSTVPGAETTAPTTTESTVPGASQQNNAPAATTVPVVPETTTTVPATPAQ